MIEALDSLKLGNSARKFELPSIRKRQVSEAKCCTGFTKCLEREGKSCVPARQKLRAWMAASQSASGIFRDTEVTHLEQLHTLSPFLPHTHNPCPLPHYPDSYTCVLVTFSLFGHLLQTADLPIHQPLPTLSSSPHFYQ